MLGRKIVKACMDPAHVLAQLFDRDKQVPWSDGKVFHRQQGILESSTDTVLPIIS